MQAERRALQRDWLGHALQAAIVIGVLGVPTFAAWNEMRTAIGDLKTTLATLTSRQDRAEHDITEERQTQTLVNTQLSTVQNTLTRIDTQLEAIRESVKSKR